MKIFKPRGIPPAFSQYSRASTATYIDDEGAIQTAGANSLRLQDGLPLFEAASTNHCLQSQALNVSPWVGCTRTLAAEFWAGSVPFFTVAKALSSSGEGMSCNVVSVTAGSAWTMTLALLAGTKDTCTVGLYANVSEGGGGIWGSPAECTKEILSGPGVFSVLSASEGARWNVDNLSATVPTLIRITRTLGPASAVTTLRCAVYPGRVASTTEGDSVKTTRVQIEAGSVATSYIPTTTAAVTRAADVLTPSATDLTGGNGPAGGVFLASADNYYGAWIQFSTYTMRARVTYKGVEYEASISIDGADAAVPPDQSTKWLRVGPENRLAAFDGEINSRTYSNPVASLRSASFFFVVSLGAAADALLLADIDDATTVAVRVADSLYGATLAQQTITPAAGASRVRSHYLIGGFSAPATAVLFIHISGPINVAKPGVGLIAWGQTEAMGCTRFGVRAGIRDYSRKEADDFGQVVFVRRAFSKTVSAQVEVEKADINRVSDRLYELRATPVVWIFSDDADLSSPLVVYGFYRDFYSSIDFPTLSIYSLEIEGLA